MDTCDAVVYFLKHRCIGNVLVPRVIAKISGVFCISSGTAKISGIIGISISNGTAKISGVIGISSETAQNIPVYKSHRH